MFFDFARSDGSAEAQALSSPDWISRDEQLSNSLSQLGAEYSSAISKAHAVYSGAAAKPTMSGTQHDAIARRCDDGERAKEAVGKAWYDTAQNLGAFDGGEGEGVDADIGVSTAIELQNVEFHNLMDRGDQDLAPFFRKGSICIVEVGVTDCVEDDIGAITVGQFAYSCCNVGRGGIDDLDRRVGVPFIRLVLSGHTDDFRALPRRQLHRRLADLSVDAHDEDVFAWLWHA